MELQKIAYKLLRFDQFPMKSGMLPVKALSEAHLRSQYSPVVNLITETSLDNHLIFSDKKKKDRSKALTLFACFLEKQMLKV